MSSYKDIKARIFTFVSVFRSEFLLVFISMLIVTISLIISFSVFKKNDDQIQFDQSQEQNTVDWDEVLPRIFVDIQGAVENPDVYEVTMGARLKDVLVLANGLSVKADREYFTRTFNLAKKVVDQEKIYVPSEDEVREGIVALVSENVKQEGKNTHLIGINSASTEELDILPGIGAVTAKKIIDTRPYSSFEELLNKKVVSKSVFTKIKDLISLE